MKRTPRSASLVVAGLLFTLSAAASAQCNVARNRCTVGVSVDKAGNVVLQPVDLVNDTGRKKTRIIWKLDNGYWFDTAAGDGVFFKNPPAGSVKPGDEFYDNYATTDDLGTHKPDFKPTRYHWRNRNEKPYTFQYEIRFHDSGNRPYILDPTITNNAGLGK